MEDEVRSKRPDFPLRFFGVFFACWSAVVIYMVFKSGSGCDIFRALDELNLLPKMILNSIESNAEIYGPLNRGDSVCQISGVISAGYVYLVFGSMIIVAITLFWPRMMRVKGTLRLYVIQFIFYWMTSGIFLLGGNMFFWSSKSGYWPEFRPPGGFFYVAFLIGLAPSLMGAFISKIMIFYKIIETKSG